jgi:hypothetical protein
MRVGDSLPRLHSYAGLVILIYNASRPFSGLKSDSSWEMPRVPELGTMFR